ncbi:unnamed protein product [Paramecium sonneborni]|uniref:Uncharacterized protein n=1 Tax=Paramecium sonneborni TaxID=65129 RepID=A0A8S1RK97_9CILI|nr:unnamed protein product [Paramecium sonneborni]
MIDEMIESYNSNLIYLLQNLNVQTPDNEIPQREQSTQNIKSFAIQTLTQSSMQQSSKVVENTNEPQKRDNMMAEYQKIIQPIIKTGVEQFDAPANYKNYYRKYNSNNHQEFKNVKIIQKDKIQNMRQSIMFR